MRTLLAVLLTVFLATTLVPGAAAHVPEPPDTICNDPMVPCTVGYAARVAIWASNAVGHTGCHVFGGC